MMLNSQRFPFVESRDVLGDIDAVPLLPLTLSYKKSAINVSGLLDTGASINVLPYSVGIQLGAVLEELTTSVQRLEI
ncbi:MAG: hypothetical protein RMY28_033645 [Nostoc sp. ChiSLP01]|nr:hypothetical protein [Nostoc sp. CmiSLP01]MDZ8285532.1 hypothetical protein [Nostoc sp. ChiSLP01]